jgi:hypothetical protein
LDTYITRLTIEESQSERKERERNKELTEERLKTAVEKFKEFVESRRATSEMCHEIITDLVVLGTPREDQMSDAAPLKEMDDNVNVDDVDIFKVGTDQDDDCEAPCKRNSS